MTPGSTMYELWLGSLHLTLKKLLHKVIVTEILTKVEALSHHFHVSFFRCRSSLQMQSIKSCPDSPESNRFRWLHFFNPSIHPSTFLTVALKLTSRAYLRAHCCLFKVFFLSVCVLVIICSFILLFSFFHYILERKIYSSLWKFKTLQIIIKTMEQMKDFFWSFKSQDSSALCNNAFINAM